jgi:hypothetical protein
LPDDRPALLEDFRADDLPDDFRDDGRLERDFFELELREEDFLRGEERPEDAFLDPEDFREELFFDDFFDEELLVLPSDALFLFTVAAAICFALLLDLPRFAALFLMCSYCLSSLSLQASGIRSSVRFRSTRGACVLSFVIQCKGLARISGRATRVLSCQRC